MDKRFQVFVSSTYRDLSDERNRVIRALLELDAIPAGMELFPASDDDQWTLIQRVIDGCDYYLLIIGGRYGSLDSTGLSYTEREYDYAASIAKPIIAFLHGDPGKLQFDKSEGDQEVRDKLSAFRSKAEKRMCKYWHTPDDLESAVYPSFLALTKSHPAVGWVRSDKLMSPEVQADLAALREENASLRRSLEAARGRPPEGVEELAQADDAVSISGNAVIRKPDGELLRTPINVEVSWNQLFQRIGPLMFDDATEDSLNVDFSRFMTDLAQADRPEGRVMAFSVDPRAFHIVKTQLRALNLIEPSDRRRSVSDRNSYWRLTPYGETFLLRLSAVRRGS